MSKEFPIVLKNPKARILSALCIAVGALTTAAATLDAADDDAPPAEESGSATSGTAEGTGAAPDGYIAEAELPAGFPGPGPIDEVVRKTYPGYRAARAQSGDSPGGSGAFWKLFNHIQTHQVAMTAPVEMRMKAQAEKDGTPRLETMAFLYERPDQGDAGRDGEVDVVDYPALEVLSIAFLGNPDSERIAALTEQLRRQLPEAADGMAEAGMRVLGYNSPMVPESRRLHEVQLILAAEEGDPETAADEPAGTQD